MRPGEGSILVLIHGEEIPIERSVFVTLLENSIAGTYAGYEQALQSGRIRFENLKDLSRKGEIPYSLFFAPLPVVQGQVSDKAEKLLAGINRNTFSIGTRLQVELREVELIVKDLIRKQELLKLHDKSLTRNQIVGSLSRSKGSPEADAEHLVTMLNFSPAALTELRTKEKALESMIDTLEANQIMVSRSVRSYMPQILPRIKFSGLTVSDRKIPFIFLTGGDYDDHQEPVGRSIFTLALLTVMISKRIFAPMTWDGGSTVSERGEVYDIAGAMLMPRDQMLTLRPTSLEEMVQVSDRFKVTPSAVTVRALRLGLISTELATAHLSNLRAEYLNLPPVQGARNQIRPENAVRKYAGREFSKRMLRALDASSLTAGEFCRVVCLKRLKPSQIDDLRRAIS